MVASSIAVPTSSPQAAPLATDPRAAALALDLSGQQVGEYQLIRRIGIGGMGAVFEGLQPLIGKRVAVKFLLPALSQDQTLVERFLSEARSVNAIGHRGIVDIFSFGVHGQMQYFVMEFLEGRPFDRVIRDSGPMAPGQVVRWLEELLDALGAAHSSGVIHRDIKPSNVFLVERAGVRPYVKLLDFGIAKVNATQDGQTPQTRQSVVIGTPEYIAPEQAQGLSIGPQTDLYAVGCMAFEMLTGALPYRGGNPLETMFKHVTEATPRVRERQPDVPPALDELVYRLMAKQPLDRPKTVDEVTTLLTRAMGSSTGPLPSNPPPSAPRPAAPDRAGASGFAPTYVRATGDLPAPATGAAVAAALPRRKGWVVPAVALLVAIALGLTAWALTRGPRAGPLTVAPPPPLVPRGAPVVSPLAPAPAPVAGPPAPATPAPAPPVVAAPRPPPPTAPPPHVSTPRPPHPKGQISTDQLRNRLDAVQARLESKESTRGQKIRSLDNLLAQLRSNAAAANTPEERRQVWSDLNDLEAAIGSR